MTNEEQYLGYLILHPTDIYKYAVRATDFLSGRCRKVYEAIDAMVANREPVDTPAIKLFAPEIDVVWLSNLTQNVTRDAWRLATALVDDTRRQRLSVLFREATEALHGAPVSEVLDTVETRLTEIVDGEEEDLSDIKADVVAMVNEFERRYKSEGELPGISSGLASLDSLILGWEPSRLYVVGARPSEGKSALLLNFALHAARKHPVGIISLESSRHELIERAFAKVGAIDGTKLRTGMISPADFHGLGDAADALTKMSLYIADRPNMRIDELKSRARRMVRQHGVKLILVDYVQLIEVAGQPTDYERVSKASVALKDLSRELEVPIIAAAQLNRGADDGRKRLPRLSDFKGSGQIEQDADVAILISRDEEATTLMVEKNRDGATGNVGVVFDRPRMTFRDYS